MKKISWDEYNKTLLKSVYGEEGEEKGKLNFRKFKKGVPPTDFKCAADSTLTSNATSAFFKTDAGIVNMTFHPKRKVDYKDMTADDVVGTPVVLAFQPNLLANKAKEFFWMTIPELSHITKKGKYYYFPSNHAEIQEIIDKWLNHVDKEDMYISFDEARPDIVKEFIRFHGIEFSKYIEKIKKNEAVKEVKVKSENDKEDMGSFRTVDVELQNGDTRKIILGLVDGFSWEVLKKNDEEKYEKQGYTLEGLNNYLTKLNEK